ncbi:uncharacterized protein C20orf194 homolog isoform X1 [Conger conger]|uniref:uncharacterized protein C20orf194 homolog isoform X1 n=1 Tax=Conger conger TaxID=82655 RepID=UPI002A5A8064|nr:uncharacterized protein C20orf194 homolog isoform X1 [Conger conger]
MAGIRRKNGRYQCMSTAVGCSRLRQVQSLLSDGGKGSPDAILCTLGIDSRYNEGCSELANFLFFGLYSQSQPQLGRYCEEFPEEVLDDVILLITAESVHLYCNPVNYRSLLPYVSHWRNLHLHCMTESEYEDEEAAEEFKISSFVHMVQDCGRIGVPYSSQGHVQKFDMFMVEKWPIIQAFALDGIGGGGFFTMKHKLVDVSEKLWKIYSRMDPVSLEILLTEDLQAFEKQWAGFFCSMDLESHSSVLELSEAQAGEPFRSYFSHGLISSHITDKRKGRQPFVLFGSHSSREDLQSYCFTFPSEGHQVRNTGAQGGPAKHMLIQCVGPKGPLACSRTYFFGTTHIPYLGKDNEQHKKTELMLLSRLYEASVEAVFAGIKCYSCTSSAAKTKDVAELTFQRTLDIFNLSEYKNILRSKTTFDIQAVNNEGRIVPLDDEESRFLVKTASMMVHDVPDLQFGRGNLGSVVFSESFLESTVYIQEPDSSVSSDSCFTILTAGVPRYVSWLVEESDVRLSNQAQRLLKEEEGTCLGTPLSVGETAVVFSNSLLCAPEEGKISFFSEGILFVHPRYGSVTLSKNLISALKIYDGDSSSSATSLFVEYRSALLPHLPLQLHSASHCLAFALQPKSRSYRAFYSQVLAVWQQNSDAGLLLRLVGSEQLTLEQRNMLSRLDRLYESHAFPVSERRSDLKAVCAELPGLDTFLQHLALSSVGQETLHSEHLEDLFPKREPSAPPRTPNDKIVINIITGLPGSHKDGLCNYLVSLNKEYGRWVVYRPAQDSCDSFSGTRLQRYLSSLLDSQRSRGTRHCALTRRALRLLLLTPGYTDVLDVVQAILTHPDPRAQNTLSLGSITACVDPLSSYLEHRFLFPKLLEQCSQGLVSCVAFTGLTGDQRHPLLQQLQQLIRAANPSAAFILAEKGAVTRNEDVELILSESSFSEPQMLRARYLLYPGWSEGKFSTRAPLAPPLSQERVQFGRPLERPLFLARCKALKSALRPSPFTGNVYNIWGRVLFSDSEQLMEVSYNVISGTLGVVPIQEGPSPPPQAVEPRPRGPECFLLFDGVGLTQDGVKIWLRQCAKQKTVKRARRTHEMLTLQEIKNIHVKRHLDPLPAGYFYNGHQFVNFFGEKMNFHPLMEQFIDEYVEEANKEIERFNRELEQQGQPDLFDP